LHFERPLTALVLAIALFAGGCASSSSSPDSSLRTAGAQVFGAKASGAASPSDAWRIMLVSFTGPSALQRAKAALPTVQRMGGVPNAIVMPQKDGAIIAVGAYNSPTSPQVQRDLKRIRSILVNGQPAYPQAFLVPPPKGVNGANPKWNLANAKEQFGQSVQYTLQVAVYESDDRNEAMRSAEQAVATYRQNGELAFYYHGPNRSMVTIGVFTKDDYDPATGRTSDELTALMKKHPQHLYNGMGIKEHLIDGASRLQPTRLVRIP